MPGRNFTVDILTDSARTSFLFITGWVHFSVVLCKMINGYLELIRNAGFDISVEISIESGNQFHILRDGKREIGYINANTCKDILYGAYMAVKELGKAG